MIFRRGAVSSAAVLFFSCAATLVPPHGGDAAKTIPSLHLYCSADQFTAFGKISASGNGEKVTGAIEVHYSGPNAFRIIFYSPLGATAGTVSGMNDSVIMDFGTHHRVVALSDPFPAELLPWGGKLSSGELIRTVGGEIPHCDSIVNLRPTEINGTFFRTSYIWKTAEWDFTATLSRYNHRLKQVFLEKKTAGNIVYRVHYASFSNGVARFISMKTDDRNYFSIEYENLR